FEERDHGSLLQTFGGRRNALQYEIGNPLTASKMTRYKLSAALYAPLRVVLFEDEQGKGAFVCLATHAVIKCNSSAILSRLVRSSIWVCFTKLRGIAFMRSSSSSFNATARNNSVTRTD